MFLNKFDFKFCKLKLNGVPPKGGTPVRGGGEATPPMEFPHGARLGVPLCPPQGGVASQSGWIGNQPIGGGLPLGGGGSFGLEPNQMGGGKPPYQRVPPLTRLNNKKTDL